MFFDDVFVPDDRRLGDVGQGWQVAMDVLPYERSTTFWHRGAHLHHRCDQLVERVARRLGDVASADDGEGARRGVPGASSRSAADRATPSSDSPRARQLGAETSIDKILIATAEQTLFETARDVLPGVIEFDDDTVRRALA